METREKQESELLELGAVTDLTEGTPVGEDDDGEFPRDLVIPD
jgi:hypothetical protein